MIGDNLKFYRLLAGLTQEELAVKVNITKMAISNYENGKREADSSIIRKIAKALNVKSYKLVLDQNPSIMIVHGAFRKKNSMKQSDIELLYGKLDRYLDKFNNIVNILGDKVLQDFNYPKKRKYSNSEDCAKYVRNFLHLPENGFIGNLVDILEQKGIIICQLENVDSNFSGMNGTLNNRPYIAVNFNLSPERQRFTLIHELIHIIFDFPNREDEEKLIDQITGKFFFTNNDIIRELGIHRTNILADLRTIQYKYGVSVQCILFRAKEVGIIANSVYLKHLKKVKEKSFKENFNNEILSERSNLFKQLVIRALSEHLINESKAYELLDYSLSSINNLYLEL
ncbi:MAG: ImmA/IrrE family metallo-endopeptidase [Candidatus Riflebacteria bacterium]|nr:ImmA/IrrE family metallo-endopeptidase [Candidatus Riflebacteria bacterium]